MLSREVELQDEIAQLLHDKELKTTVASMKADAKARFREVVDVVEDKEFWRKSKALVELCGPIMNLLRMADSDIPGTGKVYHENFKLGKILESMTDSAEFDFIPITVRSEIQSKWMSRWTDLHNPLHGAGYCLDPEFHSHDHAGCPEALTDFFMEQAVLNLPKHNWTGNVFTRQRKAQCSREKQSGRMQPRWVLRNGMKCMSAPSILSLQWWV